SARGRCQRTHSLCSSDEAEQRGDQDRCCYAGERTGCGGATWLSSSCRLTLQLASMVDNPSIRRDKGWASRSRNSEDIPMDRTINIVTDGSAIGNPGPGGWGAVFTCGRRQWK